MLPALYVEVAQNSPPGEQHLSSCTPSVRRPLYVLRKLYLVLVTLDFSVSCSSPPHIELATFASRAGRDEAPFSIAAKKRALS
jgi:hypothetical protein